MGKLNMLQIKALSKPGRYADENGLYLQLARNGSKTWIFRYSAVGHKWPREMGLGPIALVSLAQARGLALAREAKAMLGDTVHLTLHYGYEDPRHFAKPPKIVIE